VPGARPVPGYFHFTAWIAALKDGCSRLQDSPMDKKYSKHQQKIIKNYYDNRDAISLQRLSELVTELYLAEGKARERQWKYIVGVLPKLGLPAERIEHLRKKDDPRLLAELVEELLAKQK
jgi:hypothetical protein